MSQHEMSLEYPGLWKKLNNPDFNPLEFEGFRKQAGLNAFVLPPQTWIEKTGAVAIQQMKILQESDGRKLLTGESDK